LWGFIFSQLARRYSPSNTRILTFLERGYTKLVSEEEDGKEVIVSKKREPEGIGEYCL
jgi:hypothetical protein